ncbi:MAG TPA: adenylate/guanylate cyclase domain-containing protein [Bacteroidota bacterium]|nr:adenylate/guanylate cyclase domain-containing protein [Bacteroidota bacterium]
MKNKTLVAFGISVSSALLVILLSSTGVLEGLELKTLDFRFRHFSHPERASSNVVLVTIDEKSIDNFKQNGVAWPWSRDFYAQLVTYLHHGGAKVIAFDVLFSDPNACAQADSSETDGKFARAIAEAGNVILGVQLDTASILLSSSNPLVRQSRLSFQGADVQNQISSYATAVLPLADFQRSVFDLGVTDYHSDDDGICRQLPLFSKLGKSVFGQLGTSAFFASQQISTITANSTDAVDAGGTEIPLRAGNFLIDWYGRGGPGGCFKYYSIASLIESANAEEMHDSTLMSSPNFLPASTFKDKIVFVGSNAPGLLDLRNTPFTSISSYPGMEIHATLVSNLLQRDFLTRLPAGEIIAFLVLLSFLTTFNFLFNKNVYAVTVITIAVAGLWIGAALWLFSAKTVWLAIVTPEASIAISFLVSAVVSYSTEGKARRQLRDMFSRYLSPVVISEILEKSDTIELGGKEIQGTLFFSDIKDFTSISEKLAPHDLVVLLNEYFSFTTEVILRNGALLDKYIGDAIMAIFGAPISTNDHAVKACTAALEIQHLLKYNERLNRPDTPHLTTRIGINSGPVVVGNIGSSQRLDFTAIGDTVNLASRLEGLNKMYGTKIIISETTWKETAQVFFARELDVVRVKGKVEPVHIYELMAKKGDPLNGWEKEIDVFHDGLKRYRDRSFAQAKEVFQSILTRYPNDGPSQEYVTRCEGLIVEPPPADWDGVNVLHTK